MLPRDDASCLHERFAAQAARHADHVAVECDGVRLTYRDLDDRASALAARLAPHVSGPGQPVALCLGRSVDLIVGLLGIVKAGAAYVPIDPDYPDERIRLLFEDSEITTVVTRRADADRVPREVSMIVVDAPDAAATVATSGPTVAASDVAYVIYTSGSTGTPKGTIVEHRHVVRLFDATRPWFQFGPSDVWALAHSISFDFSVWEVWGALLHGGRLVIVPSEIAAAPVAIAGLLAEAGVTVLNQTPPAFTQLARASIADNRRYPALRLVILGGERLGVAQLRPWIERYGVERPRLVNMYGITETTVHVTYRPITAADLAHRDRSPIGRPIPDLEVHLRDANGAEPAPGSAGEIIVTGAGVARGYLGRPELTAERFPMLPLGPGGALVRAYRSGDLAYRRDGEFVYLGRCDEQVKVRGYRVELGEVEMRLEACPEVESCAAVAHDFGEGDTRVLAFVVPTPGHSRIADRVLEEAARTLPGYMRPARVIEVEEIPRTAHGKRDREELWRRFAASAATPLTREHGGNGTVGSAGKVAEITCAILDSEVAPDVDLFDQGVTSLSLTRLILDVNAAFGLSLTGAELDGDASIVNIAAVVDRILAEGSHA